MSCPGGIEEGEGGGREIVVVVGERPRRVRRRSKKKDKNKPEQRSRSREESVGSKLRSTAALVETVQASTANVSEGRDVSRGRTEEAMVRGEKVTLVG